MIPVQLFQGSDEILLAEAVRTAIHEALGDESVDLALEELEESHYFEDPGWSISPLVDAAQTPPFLTGRRVVVGRELSRFSKQESVAPLLRYLDDPLPTTALILVWNKGPQNNAKTATVPKKLVEAINAAGGSIQKLATPTGRNVGKWLDEQLKASQISIDGPGRKYLGDHLGENANRLGGIITALTGRYGPGAKLGVADIEPFIGDQGSVPPWELTDAMASGNIADALDKLRRMTNAGERHPLATLATLTTHYTRMVRLDGARVADEKGAAALLGMKGSTYPAKKALTQSRRMGTDRLRDSLELLAQADLDLRGGSAAPADATMEILVARLARLSR